MTTIHFVRHGEVHNPEGVYYGRIPGYRLSDTGREQAQAAGEYFAKRPLGAVYASPQQRAQETAALVSAPQNGIEVQTDERLNEIYSPWDGRPMADLAARDYDIYTDSPEDYEQPMDVFMRIQSFAATVRRLHFRREVVAVTHGDVLVFMFMHARRKRLTPKNKLHLQDIGLPEEYPATASIVSLRYETDEPDEVPRWKYVRPY